MTVHEGQDPTLPLWRAAVLLRVLTLLFALGVIVYHLDEYRRPWLALVMGGVMTVWTVVVAFRYLNPAEKLLAFT
ncbi:MAG: DUF5931 domain-containing protein, partial [Actinomycetota bacterium]|nr:DUF5931 domain-containing protein [Actinomycetota bacterium]